MTKRSKNVQLGVALPQVKKLVPAVAFDPIAAALQQIHHKTTDEDIPDDFMRLLDQFDTSDKAQ